MLFHLSPFGLELYCLFCLRSTKDCRLHQNFISGLCRTCSETTLLGFPQGGSNVAIKRMRVSDNVHPDNPPIGAHHLELPLQSIGEEAGS